MTGSVGSHPPVGAVLGIVLALFLAGCGGEDGLSPNNNAAYDGSFAYEGTDDSGGSVTVGDWSGKASEVQILCTEVEDVITMTVVAPNGTTASSARPDSGSGSASVTIGIGGRQTVIKQAATWSNSYYLATEGVRKGAEKLYFGTSKGTTLACTRS